MLQLLGDSVPDSLPGLCHWTLLGDFRGQTVPDPLICPQFHLLDPPMTVRYTPYPKGGSVPAFLKFLGHHLPHIVWTTGRAKKVAPPLNFFANFFKNYRELSHNILHTSYPFSYSQIWNFFTAFTELTKLCCFLSWQLCNFLTLSKIVSH